ncbi:virulence factor [Candidatus Rariloculus sp.]|uniref:virulence factor n=1 Tax=Candidatus Rariloculus sp. TaxID=3101265 RepID=UPI003D0B9560
MVKKVLIFWRDIPSQVILQRGRQREKVMLSARFQEAIDRAAMRAGKGGSEAYIAEWRREATAIDGAGDLREIALAEAGRFEDEFTQERLNALIRSHGVAPD